VYNDSNICNISIYFYNIHLKHLQHTSKTSETLRNIRLQHALSAKPGRQVGGALHSEIRLCGRGGGGWQRAGGCLAPGEWLRCPRR